MKKVFQKKLLSIISIGLYKKELIETFFTADKYISEDWIEYIIICPKETSLKDFCNDKNIVLVNDSKKGMFTLTSSLPRIVVECGLVW